MSEHSASSLCAEITFMNDAAAVARDVATQWFRNALDIEDKEDNSPVTVADRTIEAKLRAMIAQNFPQDGIFGEEEAPSNIGSPRVWVIDPIDGTKSFVTGHPMFGLLLGLMEGGRPLLGQIDMPMLGERWHGGVGQPSRFNGAPCQTSVCKSLSQAKFFTTDPFLFTGPARAALDALAARTRLTRFGGDCYNYGLLVSGHCDLVVETGLKPFDFLPLVPIIEGAGGVVSDWHGAPLGLDSVGHVIAAATPELHQEVLAHLAQYGAAEAT